MNFNELQTKVCEINEEMNMTGYEVLLVLDVCEMLLAESNLTEINDELFDLIVECTNNHGYTSDEFMEDVYFIMRDVQDNSNMEIIIEN